MPDSPYPKVNRRVIFKLPADIPTDRWIQSGTNKGKGKWRIFEQKGRKITIYQKQLQVQNKKLTSWRITKERIPSLSHSGEGTRG